MAAPLGAWPILLTTATSCRAGGVPDTKAPALPTLHHLPGLWAGPIGREAQGKEPGPGKGEAWGQEGKEGLPGPRVTRALTDVPLQLEPWLCRVHLEGVQREGVSSLDSGSLSLSLSSTSSLYDDIEHFLMELEQPT